MGYGDEVMASGMARGLHARGKRAAFGDGRRIIWGPWSNAVFENNPNVARPGDEGAADLEWIPHYKGSRMYNRPGGRGWIWNHGFRPTPGEFFFRRDELRRAYGMPPGSVIVEPNLPKKGVAVNKRWPLERWSELAKHLRRGGWHVFQFVHRPEDTVLPDAIAFYTKDYRQAVASLRNATMFIGPEGGMHHAAAAVGIGAVVLFGGFIPTTLTGYDGHANIGVPPGEACGSTSPCEHCRDAMLAISVEEVLDAVGRARPPALVEDRRTA